MKVQIHRDGEGTVIILPDELIASLGWQPGDVLEASIDGNALNIARTDTAVAGIADELMNEYQETLRRLGNS